MDVHMICDFCGVWYDPKLGCDHRVIFMNFETYLREKIAKRIEKACPQNPCINYEGTVICTHSYDAMLARGLDNE